MSEWLGYLLGFAALSYLAVCAAICSWSVSSWALRTAPLRLRLCAAGVTAVWLLYVVFQLLAHVDGFRLIPAMIALTSAALISWRCAPFQPSQLFRNARMLLRRLESIPFGYRALLWGAVLIAGLRILRSMVAPPLGWDALGYHLLKAGRFVQSAGYQPEGAADAWSYYEYFPYLGSVLYAWAMLPAQGDALLYIPNLLLYLAVGLTAYSCCRAFTANRRLALMGALVIWTVPAVAAHVTANYTDILTAALTLSGIAFFAYWQSARNPYAAGFACMSLALAAATKQSFVAPLVLMVVFCGSAFSKKYFPRRHRPAFAIVLILLIGMTLDSYIRALWDTGNPMYPAPLSLGPLYKHPGCPEFVRVHLGDPPEPVTFASYVLIFRSMFIRLFPYNPWQHLNFTPAGLFVLAGGMCGFAIAIYRKVPALRVVGCAVAVAAAATWPLLGPGGEHYRATWPDVMGRLLLSPYLVAAALCMLLPVNVAIIVLGCTCIVNEVLAFPMGLGMPDVTAATNLALPLCVLLLVVFLGERVRAFKLLLRMAAVGMLFVFLAMVSLVRRDLRTVYYANVGKVFDPQVILPTYCSPAIWDTIAEIQPLRIATLFGYSINGHNQYRFPLLGRHLQHVVGYISPYKGDLLLDRTDPSVSRVVDWDEFARRARERKVNAVLIGYPVTGDIASIKTRPDLFKLLLREPSGNSVLWQVLGVEVPSTVGGVPVAYPPTHAVKWREQLPWLK